jgi:hypothetical protein
MPLSAVVKTGHDAGTLTLTDASGTPKTLTVRFDRGDFAFDGVKNGLREAVAVVRRGKLVSLRQGAPVFPTLSFSAFVTDMSETGTGTLFDWVAKTTGSPQAARVSTTAGIGDMDTSHVTFTMEGTTYGDGADHTVMFKDVELTMSFAEGTDGNAFTLQGTVYGDITNGSSVTYHTAPRG